MGDAVAALVKDILEVVNRIAPFDLAESWDNSGLQAGDPGLPVKKILVSLDITMPVLETAKQWGADLLLTHHPLLISPEKSFDFSVMPGSALGFAAREQICILSAHTNLDKAENGLNDRFASIIGLGACEAFYKEPSHGDTVTGLSGLGRIGRLEKKTRLKDLVTHIKKRLGLDSLRVVGDLDLWVRDVALCTGSGGSLVPHFLGSCAQVYITGDTKYHEAREVEARNKALIDVGHFASEIIAAELLVDQLEQKLPAAGFDIEVTAYSKEKDPFKTV